MQLELKTTNIPVNVETVESSNLKALGWSYKTGLAAQFHNGGVYIYPDVGQGVYEDIVSAESVGKKFHELIKAKNQEFIKLA